MIEYGGFWKRVLSLMIDGIVIQIIISLLGHVGHMDYFTLTINKDYIINSDGRLEFLNYNFMIPASVIWVLYETIMDASKFQGTFGKTALGLVVVNRQYDRVSYIQAFLRSLIKVFSFGFMLIFIIVGLNERKKGLQDMIAQTYVVKNKTLPLDKQSEPFINKKKV